MPQADSATPSQWFEGTCTDFTPWTTEQELLEQALETYQPVSTTASTSAISVQTGKDKEGLPEAIGNLSSW